MVWIVWKFKRGNLDPFIIGYKKLRHDPCYVLSKVGISEERLIFVVLVSLFKSLIDTYVYLQENVT